MQSASVFLSNPAKLPKEWQPRLHEWKHYHCSHPDVAQLGWQKWSREHPDWLAHRASSTHPDWFNRRRNLIRRSDYKAVYCNYEQPSKATSRIHDGFISATGEVLQRDTAKPVPHNRGYQGHFIYPRIYPGEFPVPKWGLFNPDHYEQPTRFNHFPPVRYTVQHLLKQTNNQDFKNYC